MAFMEPTDDEVEALWREEIEAARTQSFEQKFLAGAELFDYACEITRAASECSTRTTPKRR